MRGFCAKGFIFLGDAHRFIDPIFSFGVTVTMREAELAAPLVRQYLDGKLENKENPFQEHIIACEKGADNLEDMIDLFWGTTVRLCQVCALALSRPDDGRVRRPHLRTRASAFAGHSSLSQNAETDARV